MKQTSKLIEATNAFRDRVEDLHDWSKESDRCMLVFSAEESSRMASVGVLGDKPSIEAGVFTLITQYLSRDSRERITSALLTLSVREHTALKAAEMQEAN